MLTRLIAFSAISLLAAPALAQTAGGGNTTTLPGTTEM